VTESDREHGRLAQVMRDFLGALAFITADSGRFPGYFEQNLLSFVVTDYVQSITAMAQLAQDGIHNVCRRELRFLVRIPWQGPDVKTIHAPSRRLYRTEV
jgi:hypothetical protein